MKLAAGLSALALFTFLIYARFTSPATSQWDFRTYYAAAAADAAGQNPYDTEGLRRSWDVEFPFVYPPHALWLFRPLVSLDYVTAARWFLAVKAVATLALLALLATAFLKDVGDTRFYVFALLAFHAALWMDVESGNVTVFEQLALWLGFWYFLRGNSLAFTVLVLTAASLKLTSIVFLGLLLLTNDRRRWIYVAGGAAVMASLLLVESVAAPQLFRGFLSNALALDDAAGSNPSILTLIRSVMEGIRSRLSLGLPTVLDWGIYILIATAIGAGTWFASQRLSTSESDRRLAIICIASVACALIFPRFKSYAYVQLLLPAYLVMKRIETTEPLVYWILFALMIASLPRFGPLGHGAADYYPLFLAALLLALLVRHFSTPTAARQR